MPAVVRIMQRGGEKHHETIEQAARFFLSQRLPSRVIREIRLRIEIRATKLEEGVRARVLLPTNGSGLSREFTIILTRDLPLALQIVSLAHEVVHVEQAATGRYQVLRCPSDGKVHARWEGEELGPLEDLPYATRPWEVEARKEEYPMFKAFCDVRCRGGWYNVSRYTNNRAALYYLSSLLSG